jgi:hypothetical protein
MNKESCLGPGIILGFKLANPAPLVIRDRARVGSDKVALA